MGGRRGGGGGAPAFPGPILMTSLAFILAQLLAFSTNMLPRQRLATYGGDLRMTFQPCSGTTENRLSTTGIWCS